MTSVCSKHNLPLYESRTDGLRGISLKVQPIRIVSAVSSGLRSITFWHTRGAAAGDGKGEVIGEVSVVYRRLHNCTT